MAEPDFDTGTITKVKEINAAFDSEYTSLIHFEIYGVEIIFKDYGGEQIFTVWR